jgi:hypothetical protein
MDLAREFYKLPLKFDAKRLQEECGQFRTEDWIDHPAQIQGNTALILVSVHGEINQDMGNAGQMAPTRYLERCPYIRQVLTALQAPVSRSRLMRLRQKCVVPLHDDIGYHWYHRVRVHVPIFTNPGVRFQCGGRSVHMAEGEAWIFDNFREHMVENAGDETRVHLVADTEGSAAFWSLVEKATDPFDSTKGQPAEFVPFRPEQQAKPEIEKYEFNVLSPTEVDELLEPVLVDARDRVDSQKLNETTIWLQQFRDGWRGLVQKYGQSTAGVRAYGEFLANATAAAFASPTLSDPLGVNLLENRGFRIISTQCVMANGDVTRTEQGDDPVQVDSRISDGQAFR